MTFNTHSIDFEGSSSQYAENTSPTALPTTGDVTIEFWINIESFDVDDAVLALSGSGETEAENKMYEIKLLGTDEMRITWEHGAGVNDDIDSTSLNLVTGLWTHIAIARDVSANQVHFYKNGILMDTVSYTNDPTGGSSLDTFRVGSYSEAFDGKVSDLRIWNDVRTDTEIRQNMFRNITGDPGLAGAWPFNDSYEDNTGNNDLTPVSSPVFSLDVPFSDYRELDPKPLGETSLGSDANLQGYWTLDSNFTDSSGNGRNLTSFNSPTNVAAKHNNGYDFNGSSQYATIVSSDLDDLAGSQSWMYWLRKDAHSNGRGMCICSTTGVDRKELYMEGTGSLPVFRIQGLNNIASGADGTYPTGEFFHLAGVYDSSANAISIYVNGVLHSTVSTTGSPETATARDFSIGRLGGRNLNYLNGVVDDAAIFDRALTAQEVFDLYTGAPVPGGASPMFFSGGGLALG